MTLIFKRREQKHIFQKSTIVFWNQLLRKSLGQCETEVHNGNNIWPENLVSCYNLLWQLPLFNRAHLFCRHLFPCYLCYFITVWYFVTVPLIYIPCQCYTVLQHVCNTVYCTGRGVFFLSEWLFYCDTMWFLPTVQETYFANEILCQHAVIYSARTQYGLLHRGVPISSSTLLSWELLNMLFGPSY